MDFQPLNLHAYSTNMAQALVSAIMLFAMLILSMFETMQKAIPLAVSYHEEIVEKWAAYFGEIRFMAE